MQNPWILCGIGIFFCFSGVYLFYRHVFEEERSAKGSLIVMLMGVVLISFATAKFLGIAN